MANYKSKRRVSKSASKSEAVKDTKKSKLESYKDAHDSASHTSNDPSWYAQSPQLLMDTASLSFNDQVGTILDLGVNAYGGFDSSAPSAQSVPGVMALNVHLTPGIAKSGVSPINIASRNVFSYIRHANSGYSNYDSQSLMMYFIAMDSIYARYNDLKRLYGVMTTYSIYNKYLPEAVVKAMGYDFNDFLKHHLDLRAYLNVICNKINQRAVPGTLSYLVRHSWMFSNVYKDTNDPKSQLYVFKMDNYYTYEEFAEPAMLANVNISGLKTFDDVVSEMDVMLDKVIDSQDFAIMSGDIVKAYGDGALFRVSGVEDGYSVIPVYNPEVLLQIHNAVIFPETSVNSDHIIDNPNTLSLEYDPILSTDTPGYKLNYILDMCNGDTSPASVMVATRLMPTVLSETVENSSVSLKLESCGSEFICGATIYYYTEQGSTYPVLSSSSFNSIQRIYSTANPATLLGLICMLTKFKSHPRLNIFSYGTAGDLSTLRYVGTVFDVDTYTVVNSLVLNRMHETALLSEFGVIS